MEVWEEAMGVEIHMCSHFHAQNDDRTYLCLVLVWKSWGVYLDSQSKLYWRRCTEYKRSVLKASLWFKEVINDPLLLPFNVVFNDTCSHLFVQKDDRTYFCLVLVWKSWSEGGLFGFSK